MPMPGGGAKHFLGGGEGSAADKVDFPHFGRSSHGCVRALRPGRVSALSTRFVTTVPL